MENDSRKITKIQIFSDELNETFNVIKYSRENVKLKDSKWVKFEYDDYDRPSEYYPSQAEKRSFRGYLFSKTVKGEKSIIECNVKFIYE